MENIKIKEILSKTYELEGLLLLALERNDLQNFPVLLLKKGNEINDLLENLINKNLSDINNESPNDSNDCYSLEDEISSSDQMTTNDSLSSKEIPVIVSEEIKIVDEIQKEPFTITDNDSRGKLVFSINDRFRFRQSLFENSDVDFNNTLAFVASMENYDEAEDYFINEQGWNTNDINVKAFLEILKKYFG